MRQKRLFVDRLLVEDLIDRRFGSIEKLVDEWWLRNPGQSRERASVYKWLSQGIPTQEDAIFGFCAMLSTDPVALIDYHKIGFFSKFYQLRKAIQVGLLHSGPIAALLKMYEPSDRWPSDWIAQKYYGHTWCRAYFDNKDFFKDNKYALLDCDFARDLSNELVTVHISYRRTHPQEQMWRPYGWVIQGIHETRLYAESGDHQMAVVADPHHIQFRTYFGARKVEFCVASLHPFSHRITYPAPENGFVGFEW